MDSHLTLYFSLVICLALCSSQPPPPLPFNMMVSLLPGNLVCDVVHTFIEPKRKRKKKNLWQDMMTYPGGVFDWSPGRMGEGSQVKYVCVCRRVFLQYMMVCLPQALSCGAVMPSVTLLRPEPCSQRNQLWSWQVCLLHSPTLFPPLNTHMQAHAHSEAHTQKHTLSWPEV